MGHYPKRIRTNAEESGHVGGEVKVTSYVALCTLK